MWGNTVQLSLSYEFKSLGDGKKFQEGKFGWNTVKCDQWAMTNHYFNSADIFVITYFHYISLANM